MLAGPLNMLAPEKNPMSSTAKAAMISDSAAIILACQCWAAVVRGGVQEKKQTEASFAHWARFPSCLQVNLYA
jgi:hypothetical protein